MLEESNASGVAQADYIYLNGRPVAVLNGSTLYYLHDDRLGTPQLATDSTQNIQWQASYEPFGTTPSVSGTITQNLRFPGQYFDVESGWNHNGFRDYMPALGRYAEPDPLGRLGSRNDLYVYVDDNPSNLIDPLGLCFLKYLKSCEGTSPNGGYGAYNDTQNNCTTGYGHLVHLGPCSSQEVEQYNSETQAQAFTQLQADYSVAAQWVNSNVPGLNIGQQNALIDLDFNMGPTRLQGHDVWNDVTAGNLDAVPADIMTLLGGGPGIPTRRANEASMWNGGPIPKKCY